MEHIESTLPSISTLADHSAFSDPVVAKRARLQIAERVHISARPNAPKDEQARVADALLAVAKENKRPRMVRAHALRMLGFIGEKKHAEALKPLLSDGELGEDARMAMERMR